MNDIHTCPMWGAAVVESEALCRTLVDMVLFDRMTYARSVLENFALMKLRIQGEYSVQVPTSAPTTVISGVIDYALGYGDYGDRLETVIAVEVEKPSTYAMLKMISMSGRCSEMVKADRLFS
jgi:hypothetical protein